MVFADSRLAADQTLLPATLQSTWLGAQFLEHMPNSGAQE